MPWLADGWHCPFCLFHAEDRSPHDCPPIAEQAPLDSASRWIPEKEPCTERPTIIMSSPPVARGFLTPPYDALSGPQSPSEASAAGIAATDAKEIGRAHV